MEASFASGREKEARKGTSTVTLFQLVIFFLVLSFVFILIELLMWRMGWILVLGPFVLPHLPLTFAVLSALACLTLTIASYDSEKQAARSADHAQRKGGTSKRKNGARGCAGFLMGFVAAMIVLNGALVLWYVSDERISISSFDITEDRTVRVTTPIGWSAHTRTFVYDLAPYSIIARSSYSTTS